MKIQLARLVHQKDQLAQEYSADYLIVDRFSPVDQEVVNSITMPHSGQLTPYWQH